MNKSAPQVLAEIFGTFDIDQLVEFFNSLHEHPGGLESRLGFVANSYRLTEGGFHAMLQIGNVYRERGFE